MNAGRFRGRASSFSLGPLALVAIALGAITVSLTAEILIEGLKAGLLTFGGAYTVIPFLQESAVEGHHWLTESQFVDGLAIGGVLPAPTGHLLDLRRLHGRRAGSAPWR